MRHAIVVIGSEEQRRQPLPSLTMQEGETVRMSAWYAGRNQQNPTTLLEDRHSMLVRLLLAPVLAYRFYTLVHNTKLWSGKRPLILIPGRDLASRVAAYAGTWGGGDVVMADQAEVPPLPPTRFLLEPDGKLKLYAR